jgi:hypothetical protein
VLPVSGWSSKRSGIGNWYGRRGNMRSQLPISLLQLYAEAEVIHSYRPLPTDQRVLTNYMTLYANCYFLILLWCGCKTGVDVYTQSYIPMLDVLFVYMHVMLTTTNEIRNPLKPKLFWGYDETSTKPYLCHDMFCNFRIRPKIVECQGVLKVPWWYYNVCIASCNINEEENENL